MQVSLWLSLLQTDNYCHLQKTIPENKKKLKWAVVCICGGAGSMGVYENIAHAFIAGYGQLDDSASSNKYLEFLCKSYGSHNRVLRSL